MNGSLTVRGENNFGEKYLKINGLNASKFYACTV
jgi:hypothetical protein